MQPIKISRTLFARLPGGTPRNLVDFVDYLNRRVAYLDGILEALRVLRGAPNKRLGEVTDALEAEAVSMRADAMGRVERMAQEIVGL